MEAAPTRGIDEAPPVIPKGVSRLQLAAKILFGCVVARLLLPVVFSGAPIGSVVFGLLTASCLPAWGYFRAASAKGWELGALGCCSLCCSVFSLISCCCLFIAAAAATGLVALAPTVCRQSNDTFDLILAHHAASKDGTIDLTEMIRTISEHAKSIQPDQQTGVAHGQHLRDPDLEPHKIIEREALPASPSSSAARRLIRIREDRDVNEDVPQWARETVAGKPSVASLDAAGQTGGGSGSASMRPSGAGGKIPLSPEDRDHLVKAKEKVNQWCVRQGFSRVELASDAASTPSAASTSTKMAAHGQGVTDRGDVAKLPRPAMRDQAWSNALPGTRFSGDYDASVDVLAKDVARGLRLMGTLEFACAIATILLGVRAIQLSGAVEEHGAAMSHGMPSTVHGASPALGQVGATAIQRQASGEPESVARSRVTTAGRQLGSALASPDPSAPPPDSDTHSDVKKIDP